MQATDVLTTIAESLVATKKYKNINEALYALAIAEVDRKIAKYRRRISRLRKKHDMTFDEFTAHLRGRASIEQEDDWLEWEAAINMLSDWEATKKELLQSAFSPS
jgi:phosphoglycerate-specific signal transduction histidine kinase